MSDSHEVQYDDIPNEMKSAIRTAEALFDPNGNNMDFTVIVHGINNTRAQFSIPYKEVDDDMKTEISRRMMLLGMNQNITKMLCMFEAHRMEIPPEISDQLNPATVNIERALAILRAQGIEPTVEEIVSVNCDMRDGNYLGMAKIERDESGERSICEWQFSYVSSEEIRESEHYPLLMGLFVQGENLIKSMKEKLEQEHARIASEMALDKSRQPSTPPELTDVVEMLKAKLP